MVEFSVDAFLFTAVSQVSKPFFVILKLIPVVLNLRVMPPSESQRGHDLMKLGIFGALFLRFGIHYHACLKNKMYFVVDL